MIGAAEINHSLSMIDKARKRLVYQGTIVERLGFNTDPIYADLVLDMYEAMRVKLALLEQQHAALISRTQTM